MAKTTAPRPEGRPDPHRLGAKLRSLLVPGKPALGGIVSEQLRPSIVKLYRQAGFDFVYVETEHGLFDPARLADFVLAARDNDMPVVAKAPDLQRPWVALLLDAGVTGIQLPRTESSQQVRQLLDWMRFPPRGTRAGAPGYGNTDYQWPDDHAAWLEGADASTLLIAHIETLAGLEQFEQIIATPGLGMLYVGPYDLSVSLGHPGEYDHPEVRRHMEQMLAMCRERGVPFGTTPSGAAAARFWAQRGASFYEACDEMTFIQRGAAELVATWR